MELIDTRAKADREPCDSVGASCMYVGVYIPMLTLCGRGFPDKRVFIRCFTRVF